MNKRLNATLNDGILTYGRNTTQRSETRKNIGKQFVQEGKLAFKELSNREQDYKLADALSSTLDLKVKTYYPPSFKNVQKTDLIVRIRNIEYEVIKADHDEEKVFLYFYLQKVGVVNE